MPQRTRAEAFDEWMRRYVEDPKTFEAEFRTVQRFLTEQAEGKPPSYGQACAAYLARLEAGTSTVAMAPGHPAEPAEGA